MDSKANAVVHYGMTEAEMRAKYQSSGDFNDPRPLCGNGNFHCSTTRDKARVTCTVCNDKLNKQ